VLEAELTYEIIGAFYTVYNTLGFGFVESVYKRALTHELRLRGISVQTEVPMDVWYKGVRVGHFSADHVAEKKVLIESKTGLAFTEADWTQTINYLSASKLEVGLALYFGRRAFYKRLVLTNECRSDIHFNRIERPATDESGFNEC
jgi:GxxExxY protein